MAKIEHVHQLVRRVYRGPDGKWQADAMHPIHHDRMVARAQRLAAPYVRKNGRLLYGENPVTGRAHLLDLDRYRAAATPAHKQDAVLYRGRIVPHTLEIYGKVGNKVVPQAHARQQGGTLWVGTMPQEGFGHGGLPGTWDQVTGRADPRRFGLDAGIGIVAAHDGKVFPVNGNQMQQLFGQGWRSIYPTRLK